MALGPLPYHTVKLYARYLLTRRAMADRPTVNNRRMVAMALIEGSSVVRILPQTKVEMVLPPPIVNEATMKSSSEIAALTKAAPTRAVAIRGIVTRRKACQRVAPRSRAASTADSSKRESLAATIRMTKG